MCWIFRSGQLFVAPISRQKLQGEIRWLEVGVIKSKNWRS
jgi:hypothetical protein